MTSPNIRRILVALAAFGLIALCWAEAIGSEAGTVNVGVYDFQPLSKIESDGSCSGILPSFLRHVAVKEGWTLRFFPGSLSENLTRLENGEIDLLAGAMYSKDAANLRDYSKETLISTWGQVFAREGSKIQSFLDMDGRSVGVVRDEPYNQNLRSIVERLNLRCHFVECDSHESVFEAIENEWIDVGVVDRLAADASLGNHAIERTPIILSPLEIRFAAPKGKNHNLLDVLDFNLSGQKSDPNSYYNKLIQRSFAGEEEMILPKILTWGLAITAGGLLLFGCVSLLLRRQVQLKTRELSRTNEELKKEIYMRRMAENSLRKSHELLEKTFSSMHDGLLVVEFKTKRILNYNKAAADIFGYSPHELARLSPDRLHSDDREAIKMERMLPREVETEGFLHGEYDIRRKNGSVFPAEVIVTPLNGYAKNGDPWVLIVRDVTERKQAQKALRESEMRLRQAQKMEAIGTLAGGIAHDFNNVLTPIIGFSEMIIANMDDHDSRKSCMEQILVAANRAKRLVTQILDFSRQSSGERIRVSVRPIINEILKLLRSTLPATIQTEFRMLTNHDFINADPTQIHQIVLNLCSNASHAMRDKGGVIQVSIDDYVGVLPGWTGEGSPPEGDYLNITVKDSGQGVDEAIVHRIFDPFFTTKKHGEGTGMGLAVVHGIVKSYQGAISVESKKGEGAAFHVYLPKADPIIDEEISRSLNVEKVESGSFTHPERILFVDDERGISDMAKRLLATLGHAVVTFNESKEAFEFFRKDPNAFDLVITDQTMPELTGFEMAKMMLEIKPDLPIVLTSGYSDIVSPDEAKRAGIREYLEKPFDARSLANTITNVLRMERETSTSTCD